MGFGKLTCVLIVALVVSTLVEHDSLVEAKGGRGGSRGSRSRSGWGSGGGSVSSLAIVLIIVGVLLAVGIFATVLYCICSNEANIKQEGEADKMTEFR